MPNIRHQPNCTFAAGVFIASIVHICFRINVTTFCLKGRVLQKYLLFIYVSFPYVHSKDMKCFIAVVNLESQVDLYYGRFGKPYINK